MATSSYYNGADSDSFVGTPQQVPIGTYETETAFQDDCNATNFMVCTKIRLPFS